MSLGFRKLIRGGQTQLHELNMARISDDVYDEWVKKSMTAETIVFCPQKSLNCTIV